MACRVTAVGAGTASDTMSTTAREGPDGILRKAIRRKRVPLLSIRSAMTPCSFQRLHHRSNVHLLVLQRFPRFPTGAHFLACCYCPSHALLLAVQQTITLTCPEHPGPTLAHHACPSYILLNQQACQHLHQLPWKTICATQTILDNSLAAGSLLCYVTVAQPHISA